MRHALLDRKLVDQALRVLGFVGHDARESTLVMRVVTIETLRNEVGMGIVLGKDNGLAEAITCGHFLALGHQVTQHLVHRIGIEQPLVQRGRFDGIGNVAVLIPFQRIPLLFLLIGQFLVADAFALVLERHRHRTRWHQIPLAHRFFQPVDIGWHATFQIKQSVSVVVNFVLGRGGQADQHRIKIIEDGAVLLIHRAVCLVDDDEVEMPDTEATLTIGCVIDQSHHGRIGRDKDPTIGVLLRHQIDRRRIRQVRLECVDCLLHQRDPVGQEQDALGPVAAHQQVGQRDDRARLAAAGGHHQQRLALIVRFKGGTDTAHGPVLVIAFDDGGVDDGFGQLFAAAAALNQQLQFLLFEEALHCARRVAGVVPDPVFVTVGIKNDGPLAVLRLQAIGIQFCLLLPYRRILAGALGLHQRQWFAIVAPQHIVDEADALVVGHAADFDFNVQPGQLPACLFEQQVDEVIAGLGFGVIVRVGLGGIGLFGGSNFGAQRL